jgi:hypothetical protein
MGVFCTLYALTNEDASHLASPSREHQPHLLQSCDLDKAWGAIHYFLSGSRDPSPDNPKPEDFLLSGRMIAGISEHVSVHTTEEVIDFAARLAAHSCDDLIARFDATHMNELNIYGEPWDESGRTYVLPFLDKFRSFVLRAAEQRLAVLIVIC